MSSMHSNHFVTGILLINTGTPKVPHTKQVRAYLRQFLHDPRVINVNPVLRWLLVELCILPFRPKKSAQAYQKIWSKEGSPLLIHSQKLSDKLQDRLGSSYKVAIGMRYGEPSIAHAIDSLLQQGVDKIKILPLFPQYSSAANGSALECALTYIAQQEYSIPVETISHFYHAPRFIKAWQSQIKTVLSAHQVDFLLFSYHGLPQNHLNNLHDSKQCSMLDACVEISKHNRHCYRAQCYATSRLITSDPELSSIAHSTSFQSRLGRAQWIKPYTSEYLVTLYQKGVRKLAVACPAFVADCLETLEEIGIQLKEQWLSLGGEKLVLVPCLNDNDLWVDGVVEIVS